jgi:hypothetical protein
VEFWQELGVSFMVSYHPIEPGCQSGRGTPSLIWQPPKFGWFACVGPLLAAHQFFPYWEDLDLSWRLRLAGFSCAYVPDAVIYHSRFAGQSKHGFRRPWEYATHTRGIPTRVLRWDWRNHLFAIIKNDFGWNFWRDLPFIATREIMIFGYNTVFEPRVLGAVPEFFRLLPRILRKRRMIQKRRVVTSREFGRWLGKDSSQAPISR